MAHEEERLHNSRVPSPVAEQVYRVLVADDDPLIHNTIAETLSPTYLCESSLSAPEAQRLIEDDGPFDLLLCDVRMSDGTKGTEVEDANTDGLTLLRYVKRHHPRMSIIVMSALHQIDIVIAALRARADDYLTKPFDLNDLWWSVNTVMQLRRPHSNPDAVREHGWNSASRALVMALSTRDDETDGHAARVVQFSLRLGQELGLSREDLLSLKLGSRLHDIGKMGIPDNVLKKPGALNDSEREKMKKHSLIGQELLRRLELPEGAARIVAQHHEKWDGSGYPCNLRSDEIDLPARIFSVIDAFDAIISDRCYRKGRSYEDAALELQLHSGTQFDPQVIEAFMRVPKSDWEELRKACRIDDCTLASF